MFLGIAQRKPEKIKAESDLKAWNQLCPMKNRTRELSVIPDQVKISQKREEFLSNCINFQFVK